MLGVLTPIHPSQQLAGPQGHMQPKSVSKPISPGCLFQSLKFPNSWRQAVFKFKFGSQIRSFHPTVQLYLEI